MTFRLLLVEDREEDRFLVARALKSAFPQMPEVIEAEDLASAKRAVDNRFFDCVLLDHQLPDGLGTELLEHMQAAGIGTGTAIIVLTGAGSEDLVKQAMKLGAKDYMIKGQYDSFELGHVISNALHQVEVEREAAEAVEELRTFVAVVAHDVKAPLRRISMLADRILRQINDQMDEKSTKKLNSISRIANGGLQLIEALLEYTELGRSASTPRKVELSAIIEDCQEIYADTLKERGGRVELGSQVTLHGDPVRIVQLFQNLLGNAIKYCEEAPQIRIEAEQESGLIKCSVEDNGIGIPESERKGIFDPLIRLHDASSYEGVGMGLAVCKKIVEQYGGRIWVEPKETQGSRFVFTLPAYVAPSEE